MHLRIFVKISESLLEELRKRADAIGYSIDIKPSVAELIVERSLEKSADSGARGLRREMLEIVENPLSEYIIRSTSPEDKRLTLSADKEHIIWN